MEPLRLVVVVILVVLPITLFFFLGNKQKIAMIMIDVILGAILILSYKHYDAASASNGYWGLWWMLHFLLPSILFDILVKVVMLIAKKIKSVSNF